MQKLRSRACIGGRTFVLETIVEHATGGEHLVLCRDDSGKLVYVSPEEWEAPRADELSHRGLVASIDADRRMVTRESSVEEKVSLIMSLFRGRSDVYAAGYVGKTTKKGKLSYWPPCTRRWVYGACPKLSNPKAVCRGCEQVRYVPLTADVVESHCKGRSGVRGKLCAIGIYVVEDDNCYLLAADFDGPGWKEAAVAFRDVCRGRGLCPAVERSRSGDGAHVWVFFDGPVKAALVRRLGEGLLLEARDNCPVVSFNSFDRLFPLQDSVAEGDLGSLIALPLQGEAVRNGNSVFVDDNFEAFTDQCAYLSGVSRAATDSIIALAREFPESPINLPSGTETRVGLPRGEVGSTGTLQEEALVGVPRCVRIRLADGVRISLDDLTPPLINRLRQLAAFRNPEFTKKLRMHFSVWDTPRYIDLSKVDNGDLVLPRGCREAVVLLFESFGLETKLVDERSDGAIIHASLKASSGDFNSPVGNRLSRMTLEFWLHLPDLASL